MSKRKDEAQRWFHQASYDLKAAQWNLEGEFCNTACFLAQQSGKKALKSLMYYIGSRKSALMTHSLVDMIQQSAGKITELHSLVEDARSLDLHYIPSRYPNGLPSGYPHQFYGRETALKAIAAAQKILGVVTDYFRNQGEDELVGTKR
jgi:HEPN domain-containing protein